MAAVPAVPADRGVCLDWQEALAGPGMVFRVRVTRRGMGVRVAGRVQPGANVLCGTHLVARSRGHRRLDRSEN